MKDQTTHTRHHLGLILALISLISAATLVLSPTSRTSAQAPAASWSYTGSLNTARSLHTATVLQNGKVLVAGGDVGDDLIVPGNNAELYDPATGTWSSTGSLNAGHAFHTATLLQNGKVLVAGGLECFAYFEPCYINNSAEVYDPATGTWSVTGKLNTARYAFTATLLPNGKVLVVGDGFRRHDAELYDPATGIWSYTGSLNTATSRFDHTATLLPNGKVLVAGGGYCGNGCFRLNSSELYDPATGTWSITGDLITGRSRHTTTLLPNGKVLAAAGGYYTVDHLGFYSIFQKLNAAELYDPATGTWSSTGDLNGFRSSHSATLLPNGKVLVAGGDNNNPESCELYDPTTEKWANTASFKIGRYEPIATLLLNGKVLVTGDFLDTAELYDAGTGATPNQIDDAQFFVRQQYLDFLNRQPDADGLAFWTNEITLCGADQSCIEAKRINVSAAFFLSIEFQQTGYLVERIYKASYGDATGTSTFGGTHQLSVLAIRLNEFLPDTQQIGNGVIVNQTGWETVLENNKQSFTAEFVLRSRFTTAYPTSMTAAQFVDTLTANAGSPLSQSERNQLVSDLSSGAKTRAQVLRAVAEDQDLNNAEFNRAFVLMQYFGYLRRNPNDAPDSDYTGYDFWLTKLNQFNGNFVNAEMVKAFLTSTEYRQRFGQP